MTTNWSPETQDLNKKVKISSLSELKRELGLTLDTSWDADFKEQISLEFTRWELDKLNKEINAEWIDKAAKLKEILKAKQWQVKQETRREVSVLSQEFMKEKPTPELMKKAFEYLEKNQVKGAHKYMILSAILDKFVYTQKPPFTIKEWDKATADFDVIDNEWKINVEYSAILNKYLTKEEFKQVQIFQLSLREWWVSNKANEIAGKYKIDLSYKNEKEKQQVKTQILWNHDISAVDQALLLEFLDWKYDKTDKIAQDYSKQIGKWIKSNTKELQEMGISTTTEKIANYARNPDQLIWDVVKSISKNPITLVSAIWLILWKIFWFDAFGKDGHFLMKLFAFWTFWWIANDIYKWSWLGNLIWDSIDWKNWVRNGVAHGFEKTWEAIKWGWDKIKTLPDSLKWAGNWLAEKISLWYYTKNYQIVDSSWVWKSLLDSNYTDIQSKINSWTFTKDLKLIPEPAKVEWEGFTRVENQLRALEAEWMKKFGTKQKFDNAVKWKSLTEVIWIVNTGKTA